MCVSCKETRGCDHTRDALSHGEAILVFVA